MQKLKEPKEPKQSKSEVNYFSTLVQATGNELASAVVEGIIGDCHSFIDTGSYSLNGLLSGSIKNGAPGNKIIAFAGEPATGKTYLVLSIIKNFLVANPSGGVLYFESEGALTKEMLAGRGIDISRLYVIPVATIEDFRTQALKVMEKYLEKEEDKRRPMIVVLDSLGMLSSNKELRDSTEGKDTRDMTKAQLIKAAFRTLTLKCARANVPIFITNHVYDVIGSYVPMKKMPGGYALEFAASIIIFLTKSKIRDEDKMVTGNIIHCRLQKGRLTKEQSKIDILLDFGTGVDRFYGLFELGLKHGIFKESGKKYELSDGRLFSKKAILSKPKEVFTEDILNQLDIAAFNEFSYGSDIGNEQIEESYDETEEPTEVGEEAEQD